MFRTCFQAMAVLACVLIFTSCSETPKAAAKEEPTAEKPAASMGPVSGKTAFWEMYKSAHAWANDVTPLSLESKTIAGTKNEAGRAVLWTATFGSLRKHEARRFTYSVTGHAPDIIKGVTVGHALNWGGPTREALPFEAADFSVDSDAAYQTALAQAGDWAKKHPDKEVSLALGNAARFNGPVWYVLWGDKKTGYSVYVSSKSGAIIK